jgi:hypothetical protein
MTITVVASRPVITKKREGNNYCFKATINIIDKQSGVRKAKCIGYGKTTVIIKQIEQACAIWTNRRPFIYEPATLYMLKDCDGCNMNEVSFVWED